MVLQGTKKRPERLPLGVEGIYCVIGPVQCVGLGMRRPLIFLVVIALPIVLARRQRTGRVRRATPAIPAVALGAWEGRSMVGPRDSVIATYTLTVPSDANGVRMLLPNREPQAPRLITAGGDSVVTETGPYDSVARPGFKVTTRTISHFRGDSLFGSFEASYSDGSVARGKTAGTRKH